MERLEFGLDKILTGAESIQVALIYVKATTLNTDAAAKCASAIVCASQKYSATIATTRARANK